MMTIKKLYLRFEHLDNFFVIISDKQIFDENGYILRLLKVSSMIKNKEISNV